MEYTKQTWTAPTGTGLSRYAKSGETDTHIELALDPVNLTNTPTPFTMARMAYMEDGIAKAYDTAPPTPWAQYSGKDIPQLPDNLAGTTQKVTEFTSIPSGWVVNSGTPVSSFDDNEWQVVSNSNSEGYIRMMPAGSIVIMYIKCISGSTFIYDLNGIVKTYSARDKWNLFIYYAPTARNLIHYSNSGTYRIKSIYIGTGSYDRLVFDNSYHYRHLLNNAVIPTPQGLYFNGATSYLRSKDKVTLPDVFTFRATVNSAKTATYQRIFEITSRLYIYRSQNTNNLAVGYYNPTTSSLEVAGTGNFFIDNIDVDTKIEIDFINKTIKFYRNNTLFYNTTVTGIQKPTEDYLYIGSDNLLGNVLLGYMRNICLYDTALTDTQRNWLAQGNTPPILYDVTNYETEGYVSIQDADGTNTGVTVSVDSNGNRILKLPATIKANVSGNLTGNASTADKWKTARNIRISDADGTNTGAAVVVDGSENETLKLPATIKANVTGNADTASKANVRVSLRHGNTWFAKTWTNLTNFIGSLTWTDGDNIYYSNGIQQYVLNKEIYEWVAKTWTGLTSFTGENIWTDGDNIYYSNGIQQYVLNKATSTWVTKTWTNLTNFIGSLTWTDGDNIYYSNGIQQYVLNKEIYEWVAKTWTGLTSFNGNFIWAEGDNIYYSSGTTHFVLNKATSTWVTKTWTGLTDFYGRHIWTDGDNIYYSALTTHFVLNKAISEWTAKTWAILTNFDGVNVWTDGENIYYSSETTKFVLPATRHNYVDDDKYNSLFGTVTKCNCSTLSDRFVFSNE